MTTPRVIAIDWSGALHGAHRKIWLAEVVDGHIVRLECGRTRDEIATHLIDVAARDPHVVVGLDFAFSMPAWFMREQGFASAHNLWAYAASGRCETWLQACKPPFWGRPGTGRPPDDPARPSQRRCETGTGAKSVFQIGGAGAVGTGSLRGMPVLHRLHEAGFHVWPYDDAGWPLAVEIYPRALTGPVVKSDPVARDAYCRRLGRQHATGIPQAFVDHACRSDDAFDALFSALRMWQRVDEFSSLPPPHDPTTRLEGVIWGCD